MISLSMSADDALNLARQVGIIPLAVFILALCITLAAFKKVWPAWP
jgi:hypothetical protein